jgi:hypothetical protein
MSNFTTKIDFLRQVKNFTGLTADSILKDTNVELVGQILLNGQPAYDETNDVLVVGDGITLFENLPKFTSTKYKIFVALVTQTGESAPTMNILENTLSGIPVFSYIGVGEYQLILNGEFLNNKTIVLTKLLVGLGFSNSYLAERINDNVIGLKSYNVSTLSNNILNKSYLEIRVYK